MLIKRRGISMRKNVILCLILCTILLWLHPKTTFGADDYDDIIAAQNKILEKDPGNFNATIEKAEQYFNKKDDDNVIKTLLEGEKLLPRLRNDFLYRYIHSRFYDSDPVVTFMGIAIKVNTRELECNITRPKYSKGIVMVPLEPVLNILGGAYIVRDKNIAVKIKDYEYN